MSSGQWERIGPAHDCVPGRPAANTAPEWSIWRCGCGRRWQVRKEQDFYGGQSQYVDPALMCWIAADDE